MIGTGVQRGEVIEIGGRSRGDLLVARRGGLLLLGVAGEGAEMSWLLVRSVAHLGFKYYQRRCLRP